MDQISSRTRAAIVRWPHEAARRDELAREGVAGLLVVAPGTPIPVVGRGEDWVWETADEREVARRLDQLEATGRPPHAHVPPVLPDSLTGSSRRVGELLARAAGAFVRRDALEDAAHPAELASAIADVRRALRSLGWTVDCVPSVGYVLDRRDAP